MYKWKSPKPRCYIGVDICSSSVKLVEVCVSNEQPYIQAYGVASLPHDAMEGSSIKDIDAVAHTIRRVLTECHFTAKKATIALPDSLTISRTIHVHKTLRLEEIQLLVSIEVEKYISAPIDDVYYDFDIIGGSIDNPDMLEVLIVASRIDQVVTREQALIRAELEAYAVDINSFAVERAATCLKRKDAKVNNKYITAIINLGIEHTTYHLLLGTKHMFSHEVAFGGKHLMKSVWEKHKMGEVGDTHKILTTIPPHDFIQPLKEMLIPHIQNGLQFFNLYTRYSHINKIFLTGDLGSTFNLAKDIQEQLSIQTRLASPLQQVEKSKRICAKHFQFHEPLLFTACGLALKHFMSNSLR